MSKKPDPGASLAPWSEAEMDFLAARLSGIKGAVVSDAMPDDWKGAEERVC